MQLKWGAYSFPVDGVNIATSSEILEDEANNPFGYKATIDVDGYLLGAGESALTAAQNALTIALTRHFQDLVFYQTNGIESAISYKNANSFTGLRVMRFDFPSTKGAGYTNQRAFNFSIEGSFYTSNVRSNRLVSFSETLSLWGGGPMFKHVLSTNTGAQKQKTWPQLTYEARQTGRAVGLFAYPAAPLPTFPGSLKQNGKFDRDSPRRTGDRYREFPITWEYTFEDVQPLIGLPNIWPINQ